MSKIQQKTHFADDATLAYIAKLEQDRARLVAALASLLPIGWNDGAIPNVYSKEFDLAEALLRELGEL